MSDRSDITGSLRILHIGKYFPPHPGGMETYLRDLMNVQKRQGLEVMALVHTSKRGSFDIEESVDALDGTTYQVMRSARWFNLSFVPISPGFIWSAFKAIKNFKPDLIHIHHPNSSAMWLLLLPAARRLPWVAHWHSDIVTPQSDFAVRLAYRIYEAWERRLLIRSRTIIATSPPYLAKSPVLTAHRERCICIPLGLDELRIPNPESVLEHARPLAPLVLFVGRLVGYKGLENLLMAMPYLEGVHCWIAGDGYLHGDIAEHIIANKLQDRVKLLGAVSEVQKWQLFRTCDAVVLPSNQSNEAFGLVLLEAYLFNKPVVVTSALGSGMSWVAGKIRGSAIAAPNDPLSLANAISTVLAQLNKPTGTFTRHSEKTLSLSHQSQQILAVYSETLRSDLWRNAEDG